MSGRLGVLRRLLLPQDPVAQDQTARRPGALPVHPPRLQSRQGRWPRRTGIPRGIPRRQLFRLDRSHRRGRVYCDSGIRRAMRDIYGHAALKQLNGSLYILSNDKDPCHHFIKQIMHITWSGVSKNSPPSVTLEQSKTHSSTPRVFQTDSKITIGWIILTNATHIATSHSISRKLPCVALTGHTLLSKQKRVIMFTL